MCGAAHHHLGAVLGGPGDDGACAERLVVGVSDNDQQLHAGGGRIEMP